MTLNPTSCLGQTRCMGEYWAFTASITGRSSQGGGSQVFEMPWDTGTGTGLGSRLAMQRAAWTLAGALAPSSFGFCSGSKFWSPETGSVAQDSRLSVPGA